MSSAIGIRLTAEVPVQAGINGAGYMTCQIGSRARVFVHQIILTVHKCPVSSGEMLVYGLCFN